MRFSTSFPKVSALNLSLPFPLRIGSSFAECLIGYGETDPWVSLTPHVKCSSSPLFHSCVLRGVPSGMVKRFVWLFFHSEFHNTFSAHFCLVMNVWCKMWLGTFPLPPVVFGLVCLLSVIHFRRTRPGSVVQVSACLSIFCSRCSRIVVDRVEDSTEVNLKPLELLFSCLGYQGDFPWACAEIKHAPKLAWGFGECLREEG